MGAPTATVTPNVYVDSIEEAREFYIDKLGFEHRMGVVGKDGNLDFAIVQRDGAMIMFARPQERIAGSAPRYDTPRPLELYISVNDVDGYHAALRQRGVRAVAPLTDQWWGHRNFAVADPYGYRLWFYEMVEEMAPPPGVTVV